ncbi:MAG TPA: hypothetical protein VK003_07725 [Oceanobacillus sp.]|nr:hypothetical protein [Oceanobacillus sp.]
MTLPPPRPPRNIDPEDLIRQIEDDALTQWVWSIKPKTAKIVHDIFGSIRRLFTPPPVEKPETPCRDQVV